MEVKRTEHKYILSWQEALLLQKNLDTVMPRDVHCMDGEGYEVRSLYFDTLCDRSCAEKEDGLLEHEKIRIRIYGLSDSVIKVESKKKWGEMQRKITLPITYSVYQALCRGDYGVLLDMKEQDALYFYHKLSSGMMPKSIVQYNRMSFCIPTNNIRITLDSRIRATEGGLDLFAPSLHTHPVLPENLVIAEVKYNHFLLGYIKDAVSLMNRSENSFSKYFEGRSFYRRFI